MSTTEKRYNYGWAVLRPVLCFLVVLEHFWATGEGVAAWQRPIEMLLSISVPSFVFISFYLSDRYISGGDGERIIRRVKRLAIPLIGWAVIYFVVMSVLALLTGHERPGVADLLWQGTLGHSHMNPSMWSQSVMILLTLVLFGIVRVAPRRVLAGLILLLLASYIMIWSGLNEQIFGEMRNELKYPLGRVAEMAPLAVLGYAAARYGVLERMARHSKVTFPLLLLLTVASVWLLSGYKEGGFGYSALFYVPSAVCLVSAMWCAPLGSMGPRTRNVLMLCCSFTLGVYCVHRLMQPFVHKAVEVSGAGIGSLGECLLIYAASFAVCWCLSLLPWRWAKGLVE